MLKLKLCICNYCREYETKPYKYQTCEGCGVAKYCSDKCRQNDYETGHKFLCQSPSTNTILKLRNFFMTNLHTDFSSLCVKSFKDHNISLLERIIDFVCRVSQHVIITIDLNKNSIISLTEGDTTLRSIFTSVDNVGGYSQCLEDKKCAIIYLYESNVNIIDSMIIQISE